MNTPERFAQILPEGALEIRSLTVTEARATTPEEGPRIFGLGSPYGVATTITGWFDEWDEEVAEGAWTQTITAGNDIKSMFNHDPGRLLGSTAAASLRLTEDSAGLHYDVDVNPNDVNAMSVHAQVMRGDVSGASVWFRVLSQRWDEPTDTNGLERAKRTILDAELFEVGPVVFPAFPTTTAGAARSLDTMLRMAGVHKRRAGITVDLLSGPPAEVETRIREIFARQPELRDAACAVTRDVGDTSSSEAAAVTAPIGGPSRSHLVAAYQRHLDLIEATFQP